MNWRRCFICWHRDGHNMPSQAETGLAALSRGFQDELRNLIGVGEMA
jgi:hypothetical protein